MVIRYIFPFATLLKADLPDLGSMYSAYVLRFAAQKTAFGSLKQLGTYICRYAKLK
jgi:hypothetical protein